MTATLVLDTADSRRATYESLGEVPLPRKTATYTPVPHQALIDLALEKFSAALPVEIDRAHYGTARDGRQMFAALQFKAARPADRWGVCVGLRNSYDMSLSASAAMGARVFVCSNLAFSGSTVTVMRRHTGDVMGALEALLTGAAGRAWDQFGAVAADLDSFMAVPMTDDRAHAMMGVGYGRGWLKPRALARAAQYWAAPPHPEHTEGTLYSVYQALNHALKRAPVGAQLETHASLHSLAVAVRDRRVLTIDVDGGEE